MHLIIGTAGHVDHGKTALVRALTGQDTDRLPEEQARGISIDIGFAEFRLPSGRAAAIVDVPGHERFIRNMLAGITGIDLVLLVVAADEGVMPQTQEHLDICRLLELRRGVIALTKCDLVDPEFLELVQADVRRAVADTFLAAAPMIAVSSVTGQGLAELKAALDEQLDQTTPKDITAFTRLPIDRVFTRAGFGSVVTGTLIGGTVRTGERLQLLPPDLEVRVRGLEVHGEKVEKAAAGQRVAVNISGVERPDLARGQVLCAPGAIRPTQAFAARMQLLAGWPRPVAHGTRAHLHVGTSEVVGRILLLDREELDPGRSGYIIFKAEAPVVVAWGDRYILRSYSPVQTMGGGIVIEPHVRYRRHQARDLEELRVKESGGRMGVLEENLIRSAAVAQPLAELARRTGAPGAALEADLAVLISKGRVLALENKHYIHRDGFTAFIQAIRAALAAYYLRYPLRRSAPKEELRQQAVPGAGSKAFTSALALAAARGEVAVERERLLLPGRQVRPSPAEVEKVAKVAAAVKTAGFSPLSIAELRTMVSGGDVEELVYYLQEEGTVTRLADDLVIHNEQLAEARRRTREFFAARERMAVADFRDLLGTSRKYALPILDYFDTERWTRRAGDDRTAGVGL